MAQFNITLETELLHGLFTKDGRDDAFPKLLETILNQVLLGQSTEQLGAAPYETHRRPYSVSKRVSRKRSNHPETRNSYRRTLR